MSHLPVLDYKNKYHPELLENRAVWKSDNQRFKEATFIQTCALFYNRACY